MSKSLEKEYQELIQDETPDLWNRIEAGLPEKDTTPNFNKKMKHKKIYTISTVAVACICLLILVIPKAKEYSQEQKSAGDLDFMDGGVAADTTDDMEYEFAETAPEAAPMETENNISENVTANTDSGQNLVDAEEEKHTQEGNRIYQQVSVLVTTKENTGEEILFQGIVMEDAEEYLKKDDKIIFFISGNEFPDFLEGERYVLTLEEMEIAGERVFQVNEVLSEIEKGTVYE